MIILVFSTYMYFQNIKKMYLVKVQKKFLVTVPLRGGAAIREKRTLKKNPTAKVLTAIKGSCKKKLFS